MPSGGSRPADSRSRLRRGSGLRAPHGNRSERPRPPRRASVCAARERIELYLGLDLSEATISQGQENYGGASNVRFRQGDLREGLGAVLEEKPFDICFSSYGALSHLEAPALHRCLGDILRHAKLGAIVVLDLVGRYSPEWPDYWSARTEAEKVRPYSMSYLYPEAERRSGMVERFPLRFWTGHEIHGLCADLQQERGVPIRALEVLDRSIFVR